ncbi:SufE family protein [Kiritimatiellaeota bacterium B1221]|nr:SufE family protein [Kiritimatiellaeota bacterium B1221]
MNSIAEAQAELIDEFSMFEDWQEKYAYIIDLGRELDPMPEEFKDEAHKVKGCQSQVWLHAEPREGKLHLQAESDALIVQGLIALVLRIYQDREPAEILDADLGFFEDIGLMSHLSMNRTNGLHSMINTIRAYAASA